MEELNLVPRLPRSHVDLRSNSLPVHAVQASGCDVGYVYQGREMLDQ